MAARRLLIVMLILLGLSTLAAALVPQRTLREGNTTQSTARSTTTTGAPAPPPGRALSAKIYVGGTKVPFVAGPVCAQRTPGCEPIHVGDRVSLQVASKKTGLQLEFPEFGQFAFAGPAAPALFELLVDKPGRFGILFADPEAVPTCRRAIEKGSPCVAARIEVLTERAAREAIAGRPRRANSRARGGSGSP
jgi:hypothetical protein